MAFKFPFTSLHEINLDWILEKVKALVESNDEFNEKADYAVQTANEAKTIAEQAAQATIADGSVTTVKLANDAVTSPKIANGAVTALKYANSSIPTGALSEGCVTSEKILDGTITASDIADNAITTTKIYNGAVTNNKIEDDAITNVKIAPGTIGGSRIADSAITLNKLSLTPKQITSEAQTIPANGNVTLTLDISSAPSIIRAVCGFAVAGNVNACCTICYVNQDLNSITGRIRNLSDAQIQNVTLSVYYL